MKSLVFWGLFVTSIVSSAAPGGLFSGRTQEPVVLDEVLAEISPGTVILMGENHGLKTHQTQHLTLLGTLKYLQRKISVGLEFFSYPDQDLVHQYRQGTLPEKDFLEQIAWGQPDYSFYRSQAEFPNYSMGERTVAINLPRSITNKVAKSGLLSLSPEEMALLPPQFTMGKDSYRKRFFESVPHPMPPDAMERYFTAQSLWDDTMAWQIKNFLDQHPGQILVVIVGEFHVQFGDGLVNRLHARGVKEVVTFSQIGTTDSADQKLQDILLPDPEYGMRADYLWLAPAGNE